MAKRLTDTDKWNMAWYRKLGSEGRDLFNYMYDKCDFAGVFELDFERMSFELGFDVSFDRVKEVLRGKILVISDDRLLLPAFIDFQYGTLSPASKPHLAVIKRLKNLRVWKGYISGFQTTKDQDQDKDQSSEEGGVGETNPPSPPPEPAPGRYAFKTAKDLADSIPIITIEKWRKEYPEAGWVDAEIIKAFEFHTANPAEEPRTPGAWMKKLISWLSLGWEKRKKTKNSVTPITGGWAD